MEMVRRKRPERKFKDRLYSNVTMPIESWGICANRFCYRANTGISQVLGSGYCQRCYDKGLSKHQLKAAGEK